MRTKTFILFMAVLLTVTVNPGCAQTGSDKTGRAGQDGQKDQILTDQQKAAVKAILSKYDKESLTAEDAKAINEAFRAAGIRGGQGQRQAIQEAGFDPEAIRKLAPPPGRQGERQQGREGSDGREGNQGDGGQDRARPEGQGGGGENGEKRQGGGGGYSLEQAVSDRAQLTTIAFDGLAFMTGGFGCNTFLPPGKVSDFFGFQYMRDVDAGELGHNTSFLTTIANNVLAILNDQQKQQLVALAREQDPGISQLAYQRFPLIKAFCRLKDGDTPSGKPSLDGEAVKKYTSGIYALSGQLAYRRAQVLGGIVRSFDQTQKSALKKLVFGDSRTWPDIGDQLDKKSLPHGVHVAVMTYASELFSWYQGSIEGDAYFCPEGHGTYFGAFYMKDMPAMGNPNYSISTSITGDNGQQFLNALSEGQRAQITGLVDQQRSSLDEVVKTRRAIAGMLRGFLSSGSVDREQVMTLAKRYGELDGEISYHYAKAFAAVYQTLTSQQKNTLMKLRNLEGYECKGAFLYSQPIAMPEIPNTDFLFGAQAKTAPAAKTAGNGFVLRSSTVADGGQLPVEFTGDGASATLPLEWSGAPAGTKSFAVIMHHDAPDQTKWYWILYDIPAGTAGLAKNAKGTGTLGNNSVNGRTEYAPPHSKGPGAKTYVYTVYALSSSPKITVPPAQVSREVLLAAMKDLTLDSAKLSVVYSRTVSTNNELEKGRP